MPSEIDVVVGGASFGKQAKSAMGMTLVTDIEVLKEILQLFKKHGGHKIDTARRYDDGGSEELFGQLDLATLGFELDTKIRSSTPGSHAPNLLHQSVAESVQALRNNKINIMYLHAPDRTTPLEQVLQAVDEDYRKGHFAKFGVSNYSAAEVEQIIKICDEKGYVKPTAYQGQYNLLVRSGEEVLFPLLRKHNISFYAYSPLAGSFLTGVDPRSLERFDSTTKVGQLYGNSFFKDNNFKALDLLNEVSAKHGLKLSEVALRWINHHSALKRVHHDAIITGGSKIGNMQNSLEALDKPALPADILKVIDDVWELVKVDAIPYHM